MAIFRKIHTSFWSDSFTSDLDKDQKLFYLYLLTNERTSQCGIYEITKKQMSFDLGYSIETISKLLKFFISAKKVKYNEGTKEIAIKNWKKYNTSTSPKVKSCIDKEIKTVKDINLIQYIYSIDTEPQEEQEEEQKQEEYTELLLSEIKISDFENINPDYYEIAVSFQNLFRENLKQSGASTKTVDRMKGGAIDDIRLTIESDGYTVEDLRQVYKFLQVDDFWKTNILSIPKLRKQMAQLKLKMANNGKTKRDHKEGTTFEELAAVIQSKFPAQN